MLLADLPTWVIDTGSAAGVVVAVTAALAVVTRARPVRWLWATIISGPVTRWLARVVAGVIEDLSQRLTDHMAAEERQREKDQAEREDERTRLAEWRGAVDEKLDAGTDRMAATEAAVSALAGQVETLTAGLGEIKGGIASIAESRPTS